MNSLSDIFPPARVLLIAFVTAFGVVLIPVTFVVWIGLSTLFGQLYADSATPVTAGRMGVAVLSVFVNLVLTSALAFLYKKQTDIQDAQRDIAMQQNKIQEQQLQPAVHFAGRPTAGGRIMLECRNVGSGPAKGFETEVEAFVSEEECPARGMHRITVEPIEDISEVGPEGEHEPTWTHHFSVLANNPKPAENAARIQPTGATMVPAGETEEFQFSVRIERYRNGGPEPLIADWQDGIDSLNDFGYNLIGLKLSITYENILDEEITQQMLINGHTDIDEAKDFTKLVDDSQHRQIIERRTNLSSRYLPDGKYEAVNLEGHPRV